MLEAFLKRFRKSSIAVSGNLSVSALRSYQNKYLREIAEDLDDINSILNLGATPEDSDKEGSLYSSYWKPGSSYYTLDKNRSSSSSFHLQYDLHSLASAGQGLNFDLILCMSTLEHTENPFTVLSEITIFAQPGSYLYVVVPWFYPLHADEFGRYGDFWRFSDLALRILMSEWEEIWIRPVPSVLRSVHDRDLYWRDASLTCCGYCGLFKKPL